MGILLWLWIWCQTPYLPWVPHYWIKLGNHIPSPQLGHSDRHCLWVICCLLLSFHEQCPLSSHVCSRLSFTTSVPLFFSLGHHHIFCPTSSPCRHGLSSILSPVSLNITFSIQPFSLPSSAQALLTRSCVLGPCTWKVLPELSMWKCLAISTKLPWPLPLLHLPLLCSLGFSHST